jgi:hypothetical protein
MSTPSSTSSSMHFLQLIGILVIANALIWAAWRNSQPDGLGAAGGVVLAFALVVGLALIFYKRQVEVSFSKEGASIKAAAEQATTDAAEIATIRQRVEAQAATLDLVAKDSAEAKKLVDSLRKENERADEKLKMLEEKTSQIVRLPDGRVKTGGTVSGDPTVLFKHFNEMQAAAKEQKLDVARARAKDAVRVYEESKKMLGDGPIMVMGGDIAPEAIARMYAMAADAASHDGDNKQALAWHAVAFQLTPNPEVTAYHVIALIKADKKENAQKLVDDTLKRNDAFAAEFRTLLVQLKVLPK